MPQTAEGRVKLGTAVSVGSPCQGWFWWLMHKLPFLSPQSRRVTTRLLQPIYDCCSVASHSSMGWLTKLSVMPLVWENESTFCSWHLYWHWDVVHMNFTCWCTSQWQIETLTTWLWMHLQCCMEVNGNTFMVLLKSRNGHSCNLHHGCRTRRHNNDNRLAHGWNRLA